MTTIALTRPARPSPMLHRAVQAAAFPLLLIGLAGSVLLYLLGAVTLVLALL